VADGLAPGDTVVAAGIHKVKAGQRVRDARAAPESPVAAEGEKSAPRGPS
jgi:hypothetical protein